MDSFCSDHNRIAVKPRIEKPLTGKRLASRMVRNWAFFLPIFILLSNMLLAQEKLERVTLAVPVHALSQLPSYAGVRYGLFREEGLEVQIVQMRTALVGPALIGHDLDFATAADTMLRAATTGLPVKVIAFGGIRPALSLNVRPEVKSIEDLKGKMISVSSRGSTTDIVAREIVRHHGLNPDTDIITMPLGSQTNQLAALRTNAVQAALFTPPYDVKGEREGFRGFVKSLIYIHKEKARVSELIAKEWKVDPDIALRSYQVMVKTLSSDGSASEGAIRKVIEQTLAATKKQKEVLFSEVADLTFLRKAQKELGVR